MDHGWSQCTSTLEFLLLKQNRGAYWNKGAYSIRALNRTGALICKTDSKGALLERGCLLKEGAKVHQHFPAFFLLHATNAWQEFLSCQNLRVKIKVTQLPAVWRVTPFKESYRLPSKGLFAWRWGTPGRPSRARKIACVYEQFLQPQDTGVRLLARL